MKRIGLVVLVIGFLIILINAVDYLGGYSILPPSSIIFGLFFAAIGLGIYKKGRKSS